MGVSGENLNLSLSRRKTSSHVPLQRDAVWYHYQMTKRQSGRHSKNVGTRYLPTGKGGKRDAKRLRIWAEKNWRKALKDEDA